MDFASDNWAGAAPEIVDAIAREAGRFGAAYGDSEIDRRVSATFNEIFERDVAVFLVGTGTAANGLALASVNRPGGVVFCHRDSHIAEHECGGVEHQTGGARLHRPRRTGGKDRPGSASRRHRPVRSGLRVSGPADGRLHHPAERSGRNLFA